ncbi:retinol binding protein receptor-domain-containing protein [Radiomyces spectabilis]|uniref:retinol binding protein receptor-domain-containing protein n=1 Tax=Radiomyces spectabilis TaxID=64574 RepID=UPI00221FF2DB|nr:retinol binding protein receptor-domain-containing protein [Radiomyces spectabilis]KAI8374147.1 retinol binding protein receptor-domain-containing protein [Radiomyces spectabilis]
MIHDGTCRHMNEIPEGWKTHEPDDWIYYPQQFVNISSSEMFVSIASVGGCCAPNRHKPAATIYRTDGHDYEETGNKIVGIAANPLRQTITVEGWYMKRFVDDHSMNLTLLPTIQVPDKQAVLYGIVMDRALIVTYQFLDANYQLIGNYSSGVLRNMIAIPDITLPKNTRRLLWFPRIPRMLLLHLCGFILTSVLQYMSMANFVLIPPVRFLCRQPSHPILMCIFVMIGSFIFSQAWNLINSQSSMFHEWLPRAAKIIGFYTTLVLFSLRAAIDLPTFVVSYARDLPFLIVNTLASIPTILANITVFVYFLLAARSTVEQSEESGCDDALDTSIVWSSRTSSVRLQPIESYNVHHFITFFLFASIPLPVKTSLALLVYCLMQLIPILLTQMVGVGGVVPTHICAWSPYLTQLQYHQDPMAFAIKSFMLMQIAVYIATLGAGGCKVIVTGFTGTLYFMVEVSLIGTAIAMAIELDKAREFVLRQVGYGVFFASFFIALIVQMIQKRITSIIFLENRKRFTLQHRTPILHYWYFMMFTSMTRALTSYILRTLKLILRYPLFSLRVDRNAETWSVRRGDGGFTAYCGMLLAEHEYNNPIVLVFVECLLKHINQSRNTRQLGRCRYHMSRSDSEQAECVDVTHETLLKTQHAVPCRNARSQRARTRWNLALTLINNPMVSMI